MPPARGSAVTLTLDRQSFVRAVSIADGPQEPAAGRQGTLHAGVHKDRTITRLAVLKAAAKFAASRPNATSSDVLKVAEAWEAWVNRPYDGSELADAV